MFSSYVSVSSSSGNLSDLERIFEDLKKTQVLVGVPQDKTTRAGEPVTNAELCFIHTNGSPVRGIPARPIIEPAIEDDNEVISEILRNALESFLTGDEVGGMRYLEMAGIEGQGASQDWFTNPKNNWPPNSPQTQAIKRAKGSTDPKPLIDTGELRKSITYVIRKG
jgi:hypothetical protein